MIKDTGDTMYVPISACYTCGNRNVPYAVIRYPSLLRGGINERERFALLRIVDYYAPYAVAKKKKKEKPKPVVVSAYTPRVVVPPTSKS